jgi:hypothetical protein
MSERKKKLKRLGEPPPTVRVSRLTVIRPGHATRIVICSATVDAFATHWDTANRRTIECTEPAALCVGCAKKLPARWKGTLTGVLTSNGERLLIDIPPETGLSLSDISEGVSLRGKIVTFKRETANIRSRLLCEYVGEHREVDKLPKAIDPEPTLRKLWGLA